MPNLRSEAYPAQEDCPGHASWVLELGICSNIVLRVSLTLATFLLQWRPLAIRRCFEPASFTCTRLVDTQTSSIPTHPFPTPGTLTSCRSIKSCRCPSIARLLDRSFPPLSTIPKYTGGWTFGDRGSDACLCTRLAIGTFSDRQ